jgi:triosephosphate isomerase
LREESQLEKRRKIVAGNWKMHGSRGFVAGYVADLAAQTDQLARISCDFLLFPPLGYVDALVQALAGRELEGAVGVGGQNLHPLPEGAYTGESSAEMLRDLGAAWVILGHSERRQYNGETDADVAEKVAAALRVGLRPVVCIGETEEERDAGRAVEVVSTQLSRVIERVGAEGLVGGAVAYEPVWAIGTGKTATPSMAQEMHAAIRALLGESGGAETASAIPLLYGGSVKSANAAELFAEKDIDGALVGGASLAAAELLAIAVESAQ